MSELTLLLQDPQTSIGEIALDASLTELHRSGVDVTRHPVEVGSDIADHARRMPDELRIEGVITNTPMILGAQLRRSRTRAEEAYQALLALEGELLDVVTSLREYKSMAITSIEVPRSAQLGNALRCTITLRHVRTVASQTGNASAKAGSPAAPPRDLGKQPTQPAAEAVNKSALASFADWVGGLF